MKRNKEKKGLRASIYLKTPNFRQVQLEPSTKGVRPSTVIALFVRHNKLQHTGEPLSLISWFQNYTIHMAGTMKLRITQYYVYK